MKKTKQTTKILIWIIVWIAITAIAVPYIILAAPAELLKKLLLKLEDLEDYLLKK